MHIPLGDAAGTGDLHHPGSGTGTAGSPRISGRPSTMAWPSGDKSPHHQRAPSLGELHQELENEQEAQVVSGSHSDVVSISKQSGRQPTPTD